MEQWLLRFVIVIFSLFALSRVYLRFRERKLSSFAFIFWMTVWIAGLIFLFLPDLLSNFAKVVGIGRGVDVLLYTSIIIVFYLIFRIYVKIDDLEKQVTSLARIIALQKENSPKSVKK